MKESIENRLNDAIKYAQEGLDHCLAARAVLQDLDAISDEVELNAFGGDMWFTCRSREDLQVLLALAPRWEKSPDGVDGIDYRATVDGVNIRVKAINAALPPTCRLVEEEVVIPARAEERVKKMVLRCTATALADVWPVSAMAEEKATAETVA